MAGLPAVVSARLLPSTTYLRRAPTSALVPGSVVEDPAAVAAGAGLEALPGAVRHRSGNDPVEGADRAIEPCVGVGEKLRAARLEVDPHARRLRRSPHGLARVLVEAMAVVGEGDRSQTFAHGESASEVIAGETAILREEAPGREPVRQCFAIDEDVRPIPAEVPARVEKALDEPELPGRGRSTPGCGSAAGSFLPVNTTLLVIIARVESVTSPCRGVSKQCG